MYMDVRQTKLKLSNIWLNATNHAIAHTLQQIYDNDGSKVRIKSIFHKFLRLNKDVTGVGFKPTTSGLTCRRSTN